MSSISRNLLLRLQVKRGLLLRHYDDEALHQLRVTIRRLRSRLRHVDSSEAQALCRDLGALARVTSAARDWDTLASRARTSLKPRKFRRVQTWLGDNRAASHALVLDMLRSQQWTEAMGRLETSIDAASDNQSGAGMARAKREVQHAWCEVQAGEDNKHWHKLRIAIKELRYTFDNLPLATPELPTSKTLKHCKRLQETLGAWHDTVVHLQMVREFANSLDAQADGELHDLLEGWCKKLEREGRNYLDSAQSYLERKGSDLLQ